MPFPRKAMTTQRNQPCPCGSGKKYKHCHGQPVRGAVSAEEQTWNRLRRALDSFPQRMIRFVRDTYGPGAIEEAWAEFTLWDEEEYGIEPGDSDLQIFFPWLFHAWDPDPLDTGVMETSLHGRTPTSVLLDRPRSWVSSELRGYLEACAESPFSFHELVQVDAGRGFRARDVFTGEEHDVLERSASRFMRRGNLFFGQLVTTQGITLMEACSPHGFPPDVKFDLIELRDRIEAHESPLTPDSLRDWDIELREVYLDALDALRNPRRPVLQNTDGDPTEFHRLTFRIPSARQAFEALKELAQDEPEDELLESADLDSQGRLSRITFPWKAPGNPVHREWSNTILGEIEISGEELIANVNSAARAAKLRERVAALLPEARFEGAEVTDLDTLLSRHRAGGGKAEAPDALSLLDHPEVRAQVDQMMMRHYENWVEDPIPALGDVTPLEAVKSRNGRERVEALVNSIEHDGEKNSPPLNPAVIEMLRERLGLDRP